MKVLNLYYCTIIVFCPFTYSRYPFLTTRKTKQGIHIFNPKIETVHLWSRPITNFLKACDFRGKKNNPTTNSRNFLVYKVPIL